MPRSGLHLPIPDTTPASSLQNAPLPEDHDLHLHTLVTDDPTIYDVLLKVLQHSGVASPSTQPSELQVYHTGSGVAGCCFLVRYSRGTNIIKLFKKDTIFDNEKESNTHLWSLMRGRNEFNLHCCIWRGYGSLKHKSERVMYAVLPYRGLSVSRIGEMPVLREEARVRRVIDSFWSIASYMSMLHGMGVFHTDIKHDNITIDHTGNAYLIDWGNAFITELNDHCHNADGTYNHLPCARLVPRSIVVKVSRLTENRYDYPIIQQSGAFTKDDFAMCDIYGLSAVFYDVLNAILPEKTEVVQHMREFLHHIVSETQFDFLVPVRKCIVKCIHEEMPGLRGNPPPVSNTQGRKRRRQYA